MTEPSRTAEPLHRELTLTRVFDGPRALVFKVWTDATHLAAWWGPHGFTNPVCEVDLRPGGALYIVMRSPDGTDIPMKGVFREIVEPERLVFTSTAFEDEAGRPQMEGLTTITLAEEGGKTRLTLHAAVTMAGPDAAAALEGMDEGWNQSLDRLAALLAKV